MLDVMLHAPHYDNERDITVFTSEGSYSPMNSNALTIEGFVFLGYIRS